MKKKLIVSLCLCVMMSATFLGCNQGNDKKENSTQVSQGQNINKDNAEEYIEKMYKKLIDKSITYDELWDDYISETTVKSGYITKDNFVKNLESIEFANNVVRTDVKVVSSEEVAENVIKVNAILKYTANGEEQSEELVEYVIKEGNELKYLLNGVLSIKELGSSNVDSINYNNINAVTFADGLGIVMNVENAYSNSISLGWVEGSDVILKTDKGEYTTALNMIKIDRGQSQAIQVKFDNAEGKIEGLEINKINYLNSNGLPENNNAEGVTHTIEI